MKPWISILTGVLFLSVFSGCRTKTVYVPVRHTSVETITFRDTVVKTRLIHSKDTIVTPDSISFLSNRYGYSWAETKEGFLHHSLTSWPDSSLKVSIQYKEIVRIDSIPSPYRVEVPVYMEKALSRWDKLRINTGGLLLFALPVFLFLLIIRKKIRKH